MRKRLNHHLFATYLSKHRQDFVRSSLSLEGTQRKVLSRIIENLRFTEQGKKINPLASYEELVRDLAIRTYSDYQSEIELQKSTGQACLCQNVVRYEPTSGSTSERKWIPYSKDFLNEINKAAAVWLADVYSEFPKTKQGSHYWSMSWLPNELREQTDNDESQLFPWLQRLFLDPVKAVPAAVTTLPTSEMAWWSTLLYLCSREDLSLISVWSPTFLLRLLSDIRTHWDQISFCLNQGEWGQHDSDLQKILKRAPRRKIKNIHAQDKDLFLKLWPGLTLISAWDSSTSVTWANQLKAELPWVQFQGKGLWATEGVLTFPFLKHKVLALQSHFYEFKDLETEEIFPSWKLKERKIYQPLLWTSSGLLRYALPDRVQVVGHYHQCPCFEFLGRIQSTDMVGEKLDAAWVSELFKKNSQWQAISLAAVSRPKPKYYLFCLTDKQVDIESHLLAHHHYKLARELKQLEAAEVIRIKDVQRYWAKYNRSAILGQNKIEILLQVDSLSES